MASAVKLATETHFHAGKNGNINRIGFIVLPVEEPHFIKYSN